MTGSMFFFGRRSTPQTEMEVHRVEVGKPHPYLKPPPNGGQALSLATGFPTFNLFLTPPLEAEIASLSGTCVGCGIYADAAAVVPIFVFQSKGPGAWAIHAPIDDPPEMVQQWIASDTNIVNFQLMDRRGIVRVLRNIGLPPDVLATLKGAAAKLRHPAGVDGYVQALQTLGEDGLWKWSKRWIWDPQREEFRAQ
ncbi:hypothetical protein SAMN02927895_04129 [Belnapia rosea]|nr:hypothetical protein SAMN02927895_04129 [Belnapia rosea]